MDFELIKNAYKNEISINKENCLIAITEKKMGDTFFDRTAYNNIKFPPIEKLNELMENGFSQNKQKNHPTLMTKLDPYIISPYYPPIFLNGMDSEIYKDILFEKISICLLLSPTMFIKCFENNGYDIAVNNKTKFITMSKIIKGNEVKFNFNWIALLLTKRFISINCVIEIIREFIDKKEKNPNCQIKLEM